MSGPNTWTRVTPRRPGVYWVRLVRPNGQLHRMAAPIRIVREGFTGLLHIATPDARDRIESLAHYLEIRKRQELTPEWAGPLYEPFRETREITRDRYKRLREA